jgi:hypothetical protein
MSELDPETHRLHDETMAEEARLQEAVNAVAARGLGHDIPAIMTALSQAIAERGFVQPPDDWITAVAVEISHGHRYVVGTRSEHDADEAERQRRG